MIEIDTTSWPLLRVRFAGAITDHEFERYLADLDAILNRGERYACVIVTEKNAPMTKSRHAKMQAHWMASREESLRTQCLGLSFVLASSVLRGAYKAILWMQPIPIPHQVCKHVPDAVAWATARLAEAGLEAPPARHSG